MDSAGNVFLGDYLRILRLDSATGLLLAVAGGGNSQSDGPAMSATIQPGSIAVEKSGSILFLEGAALKRLNLQLGTIATIAGQVGANQSRGDGGPAKDGYLDSPVQFALDSNGNIYIAESTGRVRRIDGKTLIISTYAGTGGSGSSGDDGPALSATFNGLAGIAIDSRDNIFVSEWFGQRVRRVDAVTGIVTPFATLAAAPSHLAFDPGDSLYVITRARVWRVSAAGTVTPFCGTGQPGLTDGGPALTSQIGLVYDLAFNRSGDMYFSDEDNRRLRRVAISSGMISTVAGTSLNGDGGLAVGADLYPVGVAMNSAGDLFVAEPPDVRRIDHATGIISTYAGGGKTDGDGIPALQAVVGASSAAMDHNGNLLIGERGRIRKVGSDGVITTIAGTGVYGFSGDGGPARQAQLNDIRSITVDSTGNVFVADSQNFRVRKIDVVTGLISTVAGTGTDTYSGEGGPAAQAAIGAPYAVALDANGILYIASRTAHRLLQVSPSGILSVAAGNGGCFYSGDGGDAHLASLCDPMAVTVDAGGNLFIGEGVCYCVRRIEAGTGIIQTVAGTGNRGYGGDGSLATQVDLQGLTSIFWAGAKLYLADADNGGLRSVSPPAPPPLPGTPGALVLVNAATFGPVNTAPGTLVSIIGNYLGPPVPAGLIIGSDGRVTSGLAGVKVLFGNSPAPLLYVSAGQINLVTPYAVTPGTYPIQVETGARIATVDAVVNRAVPGVFPNAILNEDGTPNDSAHPAAKGSTLVLYGTGLGQTTPPGADGSVTSRQFLPTQVFPASVYVASVLAKVLYAGPAPDLVAGVFQINVQIPAAAVTGTNTLQISVGGALSPVVQVFVE